MLGLGLGIVCNLVLLLKFKISLNKKKCAFQSFSGDGVSVLIKRETKKK